MRKRGRPPYPDILTPREWEVLALLREGLSNEQIAQRLNITRRAARYHVSEILSKLGVDSRQEAACWEREEARPLWLGALTFALWPLRHLPFGLATKATATVVVVGAAGGMGVLAWGVFTTGGLGSVSSGPCDLTDLEDPEGFECVQSIAQEVVDAAGCDFSQHDCSQRAAEELARRLECVLANQYDDCMVAVSIGIASTGVLEYVADFHIDTPPTPVDPYDAMLFPYDAERDAGVMKILGKNKAVRSMLAGRELGRDYWIRMSGDYPGRDGKGTAMVDIYFDPPVSYAGEVPDPQNPGKTKDWTFTDVQLVTARTDLEKGVVTEVFYVGPPGDWSLGEIKGKYAELFPNGVPVHKESELIDGLTGQFRNPWWP